MPTIKATATKVSTSPSSFPRAYAPICVHLCVSVVIKFLLPSQHCSAVISALNIFDYSSCVRGGFSFISFPKSTMLDKNLSCSQSVPLSTTCCLLPTDFLHQRRAEDQYPDHHSSQGSDEDGGGAHVFAHFGERVISRVVQVYHRF